jgi:methylphosphotriester-DNA--protein-cysteine methyltransferase
MRPHGPGLTSADVTVLVWAALERHPGQRPDLAELAEAVGRTTLALRRAQRRSGDLPLRTAVARACVAYAAHLIDLGWSVEAAARQAGLRNRTNFVSQFRRWFGCYPHEHRQKGARRRGAPQQRSAANVTHG